MTDQLLYLYNSSMRHRNHFSVQQSFYSSLRQQQKNNILHNSSTAAAKGTKRFLFLFVLIIQCKNKSTHTCAVLS